MSDLAAALAAHGLRALDEIGAGMEGTVVRLEGDRVAKVWRHKGRDELAVLAAFYDAVADALPLPAPRVLDVVAVGEQWATVEPLLHGEPLGMQPSQTDVAALVDVLDALARVTPTPAMATLPVLPGEAPLDVSTGFEDALAGLVERRAGDVLAAAVPGLPDLVAATAAALRGLEPAAPALVHGDLIPANVLVDERGRPSAVLDFGFLTTVGDPTFDAAVTASVVDMYGPGHRATEARLDAALGRDPRRVGVYRAAYAVVTATCFSPTGEDGHFAWCAAMLRRPDVLDAVGATC